MWNQHLHQALSNYTVVLGLSSPRRKQIFAECVGVQEFLVLTSSFEENLPKECSDVEYVTKTAEHKIPSIVAQMQDLAKPAILVVADTVVLCQGRIFEKPGTKSRCRAMLEEYRRNPTDIKVITAVHVLRVEAGSIAKHVQAAESTLLYFDETLGDEHLDYYVNTEEGLEVAGGFMYQWQGLKLFARVDGDLLNVVGLPTKKTEQLIMEVMAM